MKTKYFSSLMILFLFFSCNNRFGVEIKVTNESNTIIDSIIVTNGFHYEKLKNIDIEESKFGFIDFKKGNPKHDGNYSVEIYSNGIKRKKHLDIILMASL